MFDFRNKPFFDNHTHLISIDNKEISPIEFGIAFMHGWGPLYPNSALMENCSPEFEKHVMSLGAVKVAINLLSKKFNCHPDPDTVIAERNKRTTIDGYAYAKELYTEANVIGEVADCGAPFGDPSLNCLPTKVYRLFQMDGCFWQLLKECDSFLQMKERYTEIIHERMREGFVGIKSHVFELRSQPFYTIEDDEAINRFDAAKSGNALAAEDIYLAIFLHTLILTQELDFPVHIHTGCTGNPRDLKTDTDPRVISPIMRDARYCNARIVFLHGNYPDVRHAALLSHCYPFVWVDLSWMTPWISLNIEQVFDEVLAIAPHSKIMLGTGQHNYPEMVWVAAYAAKVALSHLMQRYVDRGLLSEEQAIETAECLLYKNAFDLYGIR